MTCQSPIGGVTLCREVATGEEGRAMTLGSVHPQVRHRPVIIHDRGLSGRPSNVRCRNRSDIGLSPPPVVAVASSARVHSLQGRVMDALAEVVSDRRLATVVPFETLPWLPTSTCWRRGTCSDSRRGEVRGVGPQLAAQERARRCRGPGLEGCHGGREI